MSDPTSQEIGSAAWNDSMYRLHPTPYSGIAGWIERVRVRSILDAAHIAPTERVLEVGCESGKLLCQIPRCKRLTGMDISREALADAQALFDAQKRPVELVFGDAMKPLPFQRGEFDVILCSEMLEHVPDPALALKNICALADEKTRLVITVPNEAPKIAIKRILRRLGLMGILFPKIEEEQSEWHLQAFSAAMLTKLARGLVDQMKCRNILGLHILVSGRGKSAPAPIT